MVLSNLWVFAVRSDICAPLNIGCNAYPKVRGEAAVYSMAGPILPRRREKPFSMRDEFD